MGSKQRGSKIKKSRLMLILKSRKITITKMAEDLGYNRKSMSRAINVQYMDDKTLDDICKYLDVRPSFITGETPLMVLNNDDLLSMHWISMNGLVLIPYNGMLLYVPKYSDDSREFWEHDRQLYLDLISHIGKTGQIFDENDEHVYFDSDFADKYISYFKNNVFSAIENTYFSIQKEDKLFKRWKDLYERNEEQARKFSIFRVIEEPENAEEDEQ